MMKSPVRIKPNLRVVHESRVKKLPGVVKGQTVQPIVGVPQFPAERVRVAVAKFRPGTHEELHWHAIEVFYYVMAGSAIVSDYHGKKYPVRRGSSIYAPAGVAGSHEWQVGKNGLELLSIRATLEGHKRMQFTVDRKTRRSYIELDELAKMDGVNFKSHY